MIASDSVGQMTEAFMRFARHLPTEGDMALLVLKGHLLIEEQMVLLVESRLSNPSALDSARLTFAQYLCVLRAMSTEDRKYFSVAKRLNNLRNSLVHKLSSAESIKKIRDVFDCAGDVLPALANEPSEEELFKTMRIAIAYVAASLTGERCKSIDLQIRRHEPAHSPGQVDRGDHIASA